MKVSRRNGINYVFNGQHTIEIVALASGSRDTPVWCMIYDDLSYEHEADIFANQMKHVKNLMPIEVFMANIEAGNHDQMVIKELVESYGLSITDRKIPGHIYAVATLEQIYFKYGIHVLNRTLRLCVATWEGDPMSVSANMLRAVTRLVVTYKNELDDDIFKERLGEITPKVLSRTARERGSGSMGFAEILVITYNGKRKNMSTRLQMNKLYEKNITIPEEYDAAELYGEENVETQ